MRGGGRLTEGIASARSILAAMIAALSLTGCGVTWDAPEVSLTVRRDDIVYTQPSGPQKLTGGETLIEVGNSSNAPREVILAHVPEGDRIPEGIIEAESAREDDRIVGYSRVLDAQDVGFGSVAGLGRSTERATFHVYLEPGERYVVFDRLAAPDGPAIWLRPGPGGDQLAGVTR